MDVIVLVGFNGSSDVDAENVVTDLSRFVHLPTLTKILLGSSIDASRWKEVQFILQYVESIAISLD